MKRTTTIPLGRLAPNVLLPRPNHFNPSNQPNSCSEHDYRVGELILRARATVISKQHMQRIKVRFAQFRRPFPKLPLFQWTTMNRSHPYNLLTVVESTSVVSQLRMPSQLRNTGHMTYDIWLIVLGYNEKPQIYKPKHNTTNWIPYYILSSLFEI